MKLLIFICFIFLSNLCFSGTFSPQPLEILLDEASGMIKGKLIEQKSQFDSQIGKIITAYHFQVSEMIFRDQQVNFSEIVVWQEGGTSNNLTTVVDGAAKFEKNKDIYLIVKKGNDNKFWVRGFSLAKFNIISNEDGSSLVTSSIFPDFEGLSPLKIEKFRKIAKKAFQSEWTKGNDGHFDSFVKNEKNTSEIEGDNGKNIDIEKNKKEDIKKDYVVFLIIIIIIFFVLIFYIKNKFFIFLLLFSASFFFSDNVIKAFVKGRTDSGKIIYWIEAQISLYNNLNNSSGIWDSEVRKTLENSISEWNVVNSHPLINLVTTNDFSIAQRNEVYFSKKYSFSSGVLAYTALSYQNNDGRIVEADIIINDNITFDENQLTDSGVHLGDIFTHEIGHLMGLSHGMTRNSSMIYVGYSGQKTVGDDDILGIYDLKNQIGKGEIYGKIIGSNELIPVFGAYVELISQEKGKVIAGIATDYTGNFLFKGLDLDDTYFLYIKPIVKEASFPDYYLSFISSYCLAGNYRGDFYSKCGESFRGYPEGIVLTETKKSVYLGNITIKCGLSTPYEYRAKKSSIGDNDEFQLKTRFFDNEFGNTFIGSFTEYEIENGWKDSIEVDLSSLPLDSSVDYFLDVKVITQDFYSLWSPQLEVYRDGQLVNSFESTFDNDSNLLLNLSGYIPLSTISSQNKFEFLLSPKDFSQLNTTEISNAFPAKDLLADDLKFYLFTLSVKEQENGVYKRVFARSYPNGNDNSECAEAPYTYENNGYISTNNGTNNKSYVSSREYKDDEGLLNCGTIDIDDKGDGGKALLSLLIGLLPLFLIFLHSRSSREL